MVPFFDCPEHVLKLSQRWSQRYFKTVSTLFQNGSDMDQTWSQYGPKTVQQMRAAETNQLEKWLTPLPKSSEGPKVYFSAN